jgi:hypothetical protein
MKGRQSAIQFQKAAQFIQSQIWRGSQMLAQRAAMSRQDLGFSPCEVVARLDASGVTALLEQFFDHAKRDFETHRDLFTGAFVIVIRSKDALPEVKGKSGHAPT